jgi:hypothetical protein
MDDKTQLITDFVVTNGKAIEAADQVMAELASDPEYILKNPRLGSAVLNYIVRRAESVQAVKAVSDRMKDEKDG